MINYLIKLFDIENLYVKVKMFLFDLIVFFLEVYLNIN